MAANLILNQRRAPPSIEGQKPHQLPVDLLLPWGDAQQPTGELDAPAIVPPALRVPQEAMERLHHKLAGSLPLPEHPVLEARGLRDEEPGHEVASIERHGVFQHAHLVIPQRCRLPTVSGHAVPMAGHLDRLAHHHRVDPARGARVDGDRLPVGGDERGKLLPEIPQSCAQAPPGAARVRLSPEEGAQSVSCVRTAGGGEVAEESQRFGGGEAVDRGPIQRDLDATQKPQTQTRRHVCHLGGSNRPGGPLRRSEGRLKSTLGRARSTIGRDGCLDTRHVEGSVLKTEWRCVMSEHLGERAASSAAPLNTQEVAPWAVKRLPGGDHMTIL